MKSYEFLKKFHDVLKESKKLTSDLFIVLAKLKINYKRNFKIPNHLCRFVR